MISRPSLALLIPAYNAAGLLPRLLKSAAVQNPPFDEILVHDDCSSDDTARVARAFGAKVIVSSVNVGCTAGKARLLNESVAEWVHFHDADDELLPGFTCAAIDVIGNRPFIDVVITGTEERDDDDPSHLTAGVPDPLLLERSPILFSIKYKVNAISGVYRRDFLLQSRALEVSENERYNEDQAIQINLALSHARFKCIPHVLTRSYRRSESMSQSNKLKCLSSHHHLMVRTLFSIPNSENGILIKTAIAERLWVVAAGAAASTDFMLAQDAARLAGQISHIPVSAGGRLFRLLAHMHPPLALRLREEGIRLLKPYLRQT